MLVEGTASRLDSGAEVVDIIELRVDDCSKGVLKLYWSLVGSVTCPLGDVVAVRGEKVALDVAVLFGRKYVGFVRSEAGPYGTPQCCDRTYVKT